MNSSRVLIVRHTKGRPINILKPGRIGRIKFAGNWNPITKFAHLGCMPIYLLDLVELVVVIFLNIERCPVDSNFAIDNMVVHRLPLSLISEFTGIHGRLMAPLQISLPSFRVKCEAAIGYFIQIILQFLFNLCWITHSFVGIYGPKIIPRLRWLIEHRFSSVDHLALSHSGLLSGYIGLFSALLSGRFWGMVAALALNLSE